MGPIKIFPWQWSGFNREVVREKEAQKLAEKLREIQNKSPEEVDTNGIVLIGHSHGGNIAIRALQLLESQQGICGVICLATPFLQALPREPSGIAWISSIPKHLFSIIGFFLKILGFVLIIMSLMETVLKFFGKLALEGIFSSWWVIGLTFILGLIVVALSRFFPKEHDEREGLKTINEVQDLLISQKRKNRPIHPPCLCLYSLADEAAGGLNFSKFITSIPYLLRDKRFGYPLFFLILIFISYIFMAVGTRLLGQTALESTLYFMPLWSMAFMLLAGLIYLGVLSISIMVAGWVAGMLFTYGANARDQFYIRMEVTLTPLFALNPEFKPLAVTETSLRHSIYKDPQVFPPIVEWWKKHCQPRE